MIRIISIKNDFANRILIKMATDLHNLKKDLNIIYNKADDDWDREVNCQDLIILIKGCYQGYIPGTVTMFKVSKENNCKHGNVYVIQIEVSDETKLQKELHDIALDVFHIIKKIIEDYELLHNH